MFVELVFACSIIGSDFVLLSADVVFRSGQGVGSIASANITILNDNIVEEVAETFTVRLTTLPLQPVRITGLDSATVTIQNDAGDGECTCNDWSVDVRMCQ